MSNLAQLDFLLVIAACVRKATMKDPLLNKVLNYVMKGWPVDVPPVLTPFSKWRKELTAEGGCLLLGIRVVIPQKLRGAVLQELYHSHPGISRMKAMARSHV